MNLSRGLTVAGISPDLDYAKGGGTYLMLKSFKLIVLHLLTACIFSKSLSLSQAAPVTFRFQAIVDTVYDSVPFDSGIEVSIGDAITGTFTFEPQSAVGERSLEVVQPFSAKIVIDGSTLETPSTVSDLTLRSLNDMRIIDYPLADGIDLIELGGTLGPADPASLPNVSLDRSSFRITLWGEASILDDPAFPADPAVWNAFQLERNIFIGVRGGPGETYGVNATIESFAIVPEPRTVTLGVWIVVNALIVRHWNQ